MAEDDDIVRLEARLDTIYRAVRGLERQWRRDRRHRQGQPSAPPKESSEIQPVPIQERIDIAAAAGHRAMVDLHRDIDGAHRGGYTASPALVDRIFRGMYATTLLVAAEMGYRVRSPGEDQKPTIDHETLKVYRRGYRG